MVDFGTPVESRMQDPTSIAYIDLLDDFFWSAKCQGFAIGSTSRGHRWGSVKGSSQTVSDGSIYSIFDSGASALIFPKAFFKRYLKELFKFTEDNEYEVNSGYVLTRCYDDFPTLYFMFDNKWVAIAPQEYVVDISDNQDRSMCVLLMSKGSNNLFVFGLPLFMDYYTVHDDDNDRLGFVPHDTSAKAPLFSGKQPTRIFKSSHSADRPVSPWSWVISTVFVLAFCAIWIFATAAAMEKQYGDEDSDETDDEDNEKGGWKARQHLWTMIIVSTVLSIGFALFVYLYL